MTNCLAEIGQVFRWESVPWLKAAACRAFPADWWYSSKYTKLDKAKIKKAKSICRTCEVRWQCLSRYLEEEEFVWGGFDEVERKYIRMTTHAHKRSPAQLRAKLDEKQVTINGKRSTGTVQASRPESRAVS